MTRDEQVLGAALDAAVRHHFESRHEAGLCVPFEQIGERSRRIVREQVRGAVLAVLASVSPDADRCLHESWETTVGGKSRRCADCGTYLPTPDAER